MTRGRHRLPTPIRLLAMVAAVLTVGGILVATGTALADNAGRRQSQAGSAPGCRSGQQAGAEGQGGGNGSGDRQGCAGTKGRGGNSENGNESQNSGQNDQNQGKNDKQGSAKKQKKKQQNANVQFPGRDQAGGPSRNDFVDIQQVTPNVQAPRATGNSSTGSFTSSCGTNQNGHRNSDNLIVSPGKVNGAQHVHNYVGNLSTDAFSTKESLNAAGTTCANGDKSTYYWPVLRDTNGQGNDVNKDGGGLDGNFGQILQETSVDLQFRGNSTSPVIAMPQNLSVITGDAKAVTNGTANANAAWTCAGFEDRTTTNYPLCPQGSQIKRILDFPSCWDGTNLDSANHRTHIVFPKENGACGKGFVAVPQLRMTVTYEAQKGTGFALDTFPDQQHNPVTDHADFINIMPTQLMKTAVKCINSGQKC
ncbi:MAG: DUF1996 domain-containing protein [Pseudonocardiaceae bacterium]